MQVIVSYFLFAVYTFENQYRIRYICESRGSNRLPVSGTCDNGDTGRIVRL